MMCVRMYVRIIIRVHHAGMSLCATVTSRRNVAVHAHETAVIILIGVKFGSKVSEYC